MNPFMDMSEVELLDQIDREAKWVTDPERNQNTCRHIILVSVEALRKKLEDAELQSRDDAARMED